MIDLENDVLEAERDRLLAEKYQLKERIRELEAALAAEKAENERLREKLGVLAEKDWYGIEGDRVEGFPNDGETPLFFNPADDTWCYPWDFAARALEAK